MEIERYKMIFERKINKELKDKIDEIYIQTKIEEELLSNTIRILGNDFMENNRNKAKLIINNKKYGLKEFLNDKEISSDKIKINMILNKDISNISHIFKNCPKLLEISLYDDTKNIDNEIIYKSEVFNDCDIGYFEDSHEYIYNNFYNNKDDIYSICSEITKREESEVYDYNSVLNDIKNNIMAYQ